MTKILFDAPLVKVQENFLTKEECEEIINLSKSSLTPGRVIDQTGHSVVEIDYRNASSTVIREPEKNQLCNSILDRISEFSGFDRSRFESLTITNYVTGQEFKTHQDYFKCTKSEGYSKEIKNRCKFGGNRVATILVYLNDVSEGGETFFPWLNLTIKPELGKLIQFNYNYDDWEYNVASQHSSIPLLNGEKWIITIWVREQSTKVEIDEYKKFYLETTIHERVQDTSFCLECGPEDDKTTVNITLPGNYEIQNTIAVGFTGGMDSSLLLYLVALLNTYQTIPYCIMPILINDFEDVIRANMMIDFIRKKVPGSNVKNLTIIKNLNYDPRYLTRDGFIDYLKGDYTLVDHLRFWKPKYVYLGDNALPNDDDPRWSSIGFKRVPSTNNIWVQPFIDLQKYHIADAIIKLGLLEMFDIIGPCNLNHKTTQEHCNFFACNERRWSLYKLNRLDLFDKYFTLKETN